MEWYYKILIIIGISFIHGLFDWIELELREFDWENYKITFTSIIWDCFVIYLLWNWIGS